MFFKLKKKKVILSFYMMYVNFEPLNARRNTMNAFNFHGLPLASSFYPHPLLINMICIVKFKNSMKDYISLLP